MKKRVVILAGILILLAAASLVLLHLPPVQTRIIREVLDRLESASGLRITAGSSSYNLFTLNFSLDEVRVEVPSPETGKNPPLFYARHIRVRIPLSLLLRGKLHFKRINVSGAAVNVMVDSRGNVNLPSGGNEPVVIPPFAINRLHIHNTHFLYDNRLAGTRLEIPSINLALRRQEEVLHRWEIEAKTGGRIQQAGFEAALEPFRLAGLLGGDRLALSPSTLRIGGYELTAEGVIENFPAPEIRAVLIGRIDLQKLPENLTLPDLAGKITFAVDITGPLKGVAARLTASSEDLSFRHLRHLTLKAGLEWSDDRLLVSAWDICHDNHSLGVRGELYPFTDDRVNQLILQLHSPDIKALDPFFHHPFATAVSGHLDLSWKGWPMPSPADRRKVIGQCELRFQPAEDRWRIAGSYEIIPVRGELRATLETGNIYIRTAGLSLGDVNLEGHGALEGDRLGGGFRLVSRRLKDLVPLVAIFWNGSSSITSRFSRLEGGISAEIQLAGTLSSPRFTVTGLLPRFVLGETDLGEVSFQGTLEEPTLDAEILLPLFNTAVRGHLDLASPLPADAVVQVQEASLEKLFKGVGQAASPPLSGSMTGRLHLKARLDRLEESLDLEASIDKLRLETGGQVLSNPVPIRLSVNSGGVTVKSLVLAGPAVDFRLEGYLGSNHSAESAIDIRAELDTRFLYNLLPALSGDGSFRLQGRIGGSLSRPTIDAICSWNQDGVATADLPEIKHLQAISSISGNRLSVESLRFNLGEGTFRFRDIALTPDIIEVLRSLRRNRPDISAEGQVEAEYRSIPDVEAGTGGSFRFRLTGTTDLPEVSLALTLQDGSLQYAEPALFFNEINGGLSLEDNRLRLHDITGNLNGGKLKLAGEMDIASSSGDGGTVRGTLNDIKLHGPRGFYSEISADLAFHSVDENYTLGGDVYILRGIYKEPFYPQASLFQYLRRRPGAAVIDFDTPLPDFLDRMNLQVNISTSEPILIHNNLTRSQISADLTLKGSLSRPALAGRANIMEDGQLYFGKNTYYIEKGNIFFTNPHRIEPELYLSSRTRIGEYDIKLTVSGTPETLSASLSSTPVLPEAQIVSLLLAGRPPRNASSFLAGAAGIQALIYLNSALSGKLETAAQKIIGLDSVRIDASLAAFEENPESRLTIGKRLSPSLELVLSQNLTRAQNRLWTINSTPVKGINLSGSKGDNNAYRLEARQEFIFRLKRPHEKKSPEAPVKKKSMISLIKISGRTVLPEKELLRTIRLSRGKPFDYYRFHKDLENMRRLYRQADLLNARISGKREEIGGGVEVSFEIDAGEPVFFEFRGAAISRVLRRKARDIWMSGIFDRARLEEIEKKVRQYFIEKRYFQARVRSLIEDTGIPGEKVKRVVFEIKKGIRFLEPQWFFSGNSRLADKKLKQYLKDNHSVFTLLENEIPVLRGLTEFYRRQGFLEARVQWTGKEYCPPRRSARFTFLIHEGPRYRLGTVQLEGNRLLEAALLKRELDLTEGEIFIPDKVDQGVGKIKKLYGDKGFNQVQVEPGIQIQTRAGKVDLKFDIRENRREIIKEIRIIGNHLTRAYIVRRSLDFQVGDPLNHYAINRARKRLYDTGIFERVNIEAVPLEEPETTGSSSRPYRIDVQLHEQKPLRLRYGFQYDSENRLGISAELTHFNLLGRSQSLGTGLRLNQKEREIRAFFRFPYILGQKTESQVFAFARREIKPDLNVDRLGLTLQQQSRLGRACLFSCNYTIEHSHTFDKPVFPTLDHTFKIGRLNAAFTYDSRDNLLNARRGLFLSNSIEWASGFLGSDTAFLRYFGQVNIYRVITGSLTYGGAIRLGLGTGLDQVLIPTEKFYAGGGTTIRGFKQDSLGPTDPRTGLPGGGEAVLILNQELRFPLLRPLSGVVFLDAGNVFPEIADFSLKHLRAAAGVGLRYQLGFLLFRLDLGFKLDRRPGESPSTLFFSLGQSF